MDRDSSQLAGILACRGRFCGPAGRSRGRWGPTIYAHRRRKLVRPALGQNVANPVFAEELAAPDGSQYSTGGSGAPMVLLHGMGLDRHMWSASAAHLTDTYLVVAPDLLGHGGSAAPACEVTLQDLVDQVLALLDHLQLERASVVGFDFGGLVAIALAARAPERVSGLGLIGTPHSRLKAQRDSIRQRIVQASRHGPAANADSAIQRWFSAAFHVSHKDVVKSIRERIASNEPSSYLALSELACEADRETAKDARQVKCPAVVICGALDGESTPSTARHLSSAISGSKLVIVPRQRHMIPLEAPALLADSLASVLGSL
jgi:(E)-2-((N-methylformamido)methylene)succinate hydrolase